jgi:3-oxoacyl-[acyl-carrier-protein] synthase II
MGLAFEDLRAGRLMAALAGAAEASLTPLIAASFDNLGTLNPAKTVAELRGPFDRQRQGFVLGEAGAVLLLESEDALAITGHRAMAELLGWACTADAYHLTAPDPKGSGAARCLRLALAQAGVAPSAVAWVKAHGSGTLVGDQAEARALNAVFGSGPRPRLSSLKGAVGHTLGAAGALEAVATVRALRDRVLPGNRACVEPLPELAAGLARVDEPLEGDVAVALSMGFGGHNVALVFRRAAWAGWTR